MFFPKSIVKGKRRKRYVFLTHETVKFLKPLMDSVKDEEALIFSPNPELDINHQSAIFNQLYPEFNFTG